MPFFVVRRLEEWKPQSYIRNETFLDTTIINSELDIDGYVLHRKDRGSRHGGGVAIYIKSSICHESCDSLNIDTNTEAYWLKVKPEVEKSFWCALCTGLPVQAKLILIIFWIILELPVKCAVILSYLEI